MAVNCDWKGVIHDSEILTEVEKEGKSQIENGIKTKQKRVENCVLSLLKTMLSAWMNTSERTRLFRLTLSDRLKSS